MKSLGMRKLGCSISMAGARNLLCMAHALMFIAVIPKPTVLHVFIHMASLFCAKKDEAFLNSEQLAYRKQSGSM